MGLFSFFRKKEGSKVYTNSMAVDPVEKTAEYKAVANEVDRLVRAEIGEGGYLGYCHVYWAAKNVFFSNVIIYRGVLRQSSIRIFILINCCKGVKL